jgi:Tfp pilus assembly protein PilO
MAMSPEEQKKAVTAGVLAVIVAVACFMVPGYGINNTRKVIATHKELNAEKLEDLQEKQQKVANLDSITRQLNDKREELEMQERRLPETADMDAVYDSLHGMGERYGVTFISSERLDPLRDNEEGVETFPIQLKMLVPYHNLGRLINEIENAERFLKVDTMLVNHGVERELGTPGHDWAVQTVEMQLSTYRFFEVVKKKEEKKPGASTTKKKKK